MKTSLQWNATAISSRIVFIAAISLSLVAAPATGQAPPIGSGPNPALPPVHQIVIQPTLVPGTTSSYEWMLPELPVYFDPAAGPIAKILDPPPGGWNPTAVYKLHEQIKLVPTPTGLPYNLRDWHERIFDDEPFNPSFASWLADPQPGIEVWTMDAAGAMEQFPAPGLQTMLTGSQIWFTFDPIMPPIEPGSMVALHIWKSFRVIPNIGLGRITVIEWPTVPEPTTFALAGLGGLAMLAIRRR